MSDRLPNAKAVHSHVTENGYKVAVSTVYEHIRNGRLGEHKDGGFDLKAVNEYAAKFLKKVGGSRPAADEVEELQRQVAEADLQKKKAQALHWETKAKIERGLYIEKSLFNGELAARAALFKSDLENFARSQAADLVALVHGDSNFVPDFIEAVLAGFNEILGRYAQPKTWPVKTTVEFTDEDEA